MRDVVSKLSEGDAACRELPYELGGGGENQVGSRANVERGEVRDKRCWKRWCKVGQGRWRRSRVHGGCLVRLGVTNSINYTVEPARRIPHLSVAFLNLSIVHGA